MSKEPETDFEFVQKWMKKAVENCRAQGKLESAMLWSDALQHLEYQHDRIAELEQQAAELSKDKARLDWFEIVRDKVVILDYYHPVSGHEKDVIVGMKAYNGRGIRAPVDAAIAKEQAHE